MIAYVSYIVVATIDRFVISYAFLDELVYSAYFPLHHLGFVRFARFKTLENLKFPRVVILRVTIYVIRFTKLFFKGIDTFIFGNFFFFKKEKIEKRIRSNSCVLVIWKEKNKNEVK